MLEIAGLMLGAVLTLLVLSYLLGDNPLYRLALHLFVGGLVGYSFGIVLRDVLMGTILAGLLENPPAVAIPLVLGLLLLFKGFPKQAYVGNLSLAYLLGVGVAVALSGALLGTIVPQVQATAHAFNPGSLSSPSLATVDDLMILVGTVCTLMSFAFAVPKPRGLAGAWGQVVRGAGAVGRVFLTCALGTAFAGALTASLSIFIARIQYLIDAFTQLYLQVVGL